jgi:drug/metabolite transporter (DMT)-like permease
MARVVEALRQLGPSRLRLIAAFAAVYLIWGSTYLAIRFAIETLPPFLMAGVRFLLAGGLLFAWARSKGATPPTFAQWRTAAIIGALLLLGGNGGVVWAEQYVDSGLAALLITSEPFWIVLLVWILPGGHRPRGAVLLGLLLGLLGIALLVGPSNLVGGPRVSLAGAAVLILASLSWAAGSLYSSRARIPGSAPLAAGMQMLAGGILLAALGLAAGELRGLNLALASARSILSLVYLLIFGSLVGFSAYFYLLRNTTPARASTYAFVNPVVAVFLGWAFAGEKITGLTLLATAIIVLGVMLVILRGHAHDEQPAPAADCACPASTPPSHESLSGFSACRNDVPTPASEEGS